MTQQVITLKGGSLNSTCLHIDGDRKFVRKTISTSADREYGYVRWYSQLKKLQRFNALVPGCVPQVYDAGFTTDGAYFDIEYVDAKDIKKAIKNRCKSKFPRSSASKLVGLKIIQKIKNLFLEKYLANIKKIIITKNIIDKFGIMK